MLHSVAYVWRTEQRNPLVFVISGITIPSGQCSVIYRGPLLIAIELLFSPFPVPSSSLSLFKCRVAYSNPPPSPRAAYSARLFLCVKHTPTTYVVYRSCQIVVFTPPSSFTLMGLIDRRVCPRCPLPDLCVSPLSLYLNPHLLPSPASLILVSPRAHRHDSFPSLSLALFLFSLTVIRFIVRYSLSLVLTGPHSAKSAQCACLDRYTRMYVWAVHSACVCVENASFFPFPHQLS